MKQTMTRRIHESWSEGVQGVYINGEMVDTGDVGKFGYKITDYTCEYAGGALYAVLKDIKHRDLSLEEKYYRELSEMKKVEV